MRTFSIRLGYLLVALHTLGACTTLKPPANPADAQWMYQQQPHEALSACHPGGLPADYAANLEVSAQALGGRSLFLGPGDRLRLSLAGDEGLVSGTYVIAEDGTINLPGAGRVAIEGLGEDTAQRHILSALTASGFAREGGNFLDLRLVESAGVSVFVSGAVFDPGQIRTGERPVESRRPQETSTFGDDNPGRTVSGALRAAGGLRPDADVQQIWLGRDGRWARVDLLAMLDGRGVSEVAVRSGDRIYVPSTGCFDARLVRPSAVTTPGVRVYMSNLTRPAASNASSAVGKETTSLPYGTRMLQALVDMNCVGGSAMNSGRHAVLISRNPMNGHGIVVQRAVEGLVRQAGRDAWDPYLMPGDALACYDSGLANFQDVVSLLGSFTGIATTALIMNRASN